MSTIEHIIRCTNCTWKRRSVIERTKPQSKLQEIVLTLAPTNKPEISKCPECGGVVISRTKHMVG